MATLAPPPGPARTSAPARKPRNDHWARRLTRSGYFLGAVLFHLILFLLVATWVVFRPAIPPTEDFVKTYVPAGGSPPPPPPPQETQQVPSKALSTPQNVIVSTSMAPTPFNVPMPDISVSETTAPKAPPKTVKPSDNLKSRLSGIRSTETNSWGRSASNIQDSNGDPHNVVATFPVFLASYENGDWGCNTHLEDGQITAGSLADLVQKMNEWAHGSLKGHVEPVPLAIGGPELMAKKPPFIFFTGHKDFTLTPQEVQNLQEYLNNGGAIWGDNALPGSGSRFDIAFKREMKKVIPDIDKNWQDYPLTADIFTHSWFTIDKVPEGMNYFTEPIQHIDIDGKLAVIYTPNDYSDLFFMRIPPGDTVLDRGFATPGQPLFTYRLFTDHQAMFFRNFDLPTGIDAFRMGMNIIGHMLVRFDKDLSAP